MRALSSCVFSMCQAVVRSPDPARVWGTVYLASRNGLSRRFGCGIDNIENPGVDPPDRHQFTG